MLEKERAEERKKREQLEQVQAAEKLRRKQEAARREEDRIKREIEEKEMEEAKALLGNKKLKEGEKLNKQKIMHVSTVIEAVDFRIVYEWACDDQYKHISENPLRTNHETLKPQSFCLVYCLKYFPTCSPIVHDEALCYTLNENITLISDY